ncbi:Alpha-mannosidase [Caenorhabditis elegans]|uniref:Alpha-mannosidase n=1 Tax=Caenorhabditis elegans TaxID=6239 RepID=A0A5K1I7Y9_CAEEL|nr:Alpha-mannosidase [Caenorhabditis elegans]VWL57857.1 Alpha-mannosidase [Caenorhabditis elegans]
MHRLALSAKRKVLLNPKTVSIYFFAILFTFLLAYHQRLGQHNNELHISRVVNMRSFVKEANNLSNSQKNPNIFEPKNEVCQRPLTESSTNFNTFDLFESVVAKGNTLPPASKKSRTEKLKVYVLPFTHVDPGWLETFERYTKSTNQILDNMHQFMMKNEKMRFMWAEFVFFERWWSLQNEQVKEDVKKLVTEGRLELATGSWVMTDEANPYFPVSVDNIVEGFQFIHKNFGIKPQTMWSNDPFGYSNSVPYLFKKSGVHRTVINRIHHKLKQTLQSQKAIPFKWRQYFDATGEDDVLTQILPYTHYDILNSCGSDASVCCEFDFKRMTHWSCPGPKPEKITNANVAAKAEKLVNQLEKMSEMYKAPVILMMHGDDFRFDMIEEWNQQHDNFIPVFDEINKGSRVEIRFGTFTDYFNDLEKWYSNNKDSEPPTVSGDFFPYMCALGDYWTGYYTTRPFFKRQGRLLHSLIRNGDIMLSMLRVNLKQRKIGENVKRLEAARRNLALFQHHDAITGTSKVSVMDNYSELLHASIVSTNIVLENLTKSDIDLYPRIHDGIELQTIVDLESSEKEIRIFNSHLFEITDVFKIRVKEREVIVSIDGKIIEAQLEPFFQKSKVEKDSFLLLFQATVLPLSMMKVKVQRGDSGGLTKMAKIEAKDTNAWDLGSWTIASSTSAPNLETPYFKVSNDPITGAIQSVNKLSDNSKFHCQQSFYNYKEAGGGAYLMRLHTNPKEIIEYQWLKVSGPLRQSIYQKSTNVLQRLSIHNVEGPSGEEVDISMSIDITKERNTELMTRFSTKWDKPLTYTDSVGMQLLRRDFYKLPVQSNYYPMPTAAVLQSGKQRLSIVSNVEHGARFLESGTVEINIDRILNQDDGKGLGTGPDAIPIDMKPVDMKFKLIFDSLESDPTENSRYSTHSFRAQQAVQTIIYPPMMFNRPPKKEEDIEEIEEISNLKFPCDIQLLTVRPLEDNKQLLILYRHATVCSSQKVGNCGGELKSSLMDLLIKLGAKQVQKTDLSGVTRVGGIIKVEYLPDYELKTFDFLTLILYR